MKPQGFFRHSFGDDKILEDNEVKIMQENGFLETEFLHRAQDMVQRLFSNYSKIFTSTEILFNKNLSKHSLN